MLTVRPLKLDDDLYALTRLIYMTDIYIYPAWFRSFEEAVLLVPNIIKRETLYNYKNIIVCLVNGKIAGFICYIDKYPKNNFEEMIKAYQDSKITPSEGFYDVNEGYFEKMDFDFNGRYLLCCAVLPEYRRKGIASRMLEYFGDMTLQLAAVKDNYIAIKTYEKNGFKYMYEYLGYTDIPCVEMIKGGKNNANGK